MWHRNLVSLASASRWVALVLATTALAGAKVAVGDAFPAIPPMEFTRLSGDEMPALPGKVVLVDFWASWCEPCKESFPIMAKLHKEYAARGFTVVAIGVDATPAQAQAFWKKMAAPFVGLYDREQKFVNQVAPKGLPTSYLVGRDGRVRFVHESSRGDIEKTLRKNIEALLAEKN